MCVAAVRDESQVTPSGKPHFYVMMCVDSHRVCTCSRGGENGGLGSGFGLAD